jgi:hypothetical protein
VRVVILTDEAADIDRRNLLAAESLVDDGHEVILIARRNDHTPADQIIGRVKVCWIDTTLHYLYGMLDETDLSHLEPAPRGARPNPTIWRRLMDQTTRIGVRDLRYALLRLWGDADRAIRNWAGRLLDDCRDLARPWRCIAYVRELPDHTFASTLQAIYDIARIPTVPRTSIEYTEPPEAIDMTPWENALYYRCRYFDPDAIHAVNLPQLLPAVRVARELKVPLIYDARVIYPLASTVGPEERAALWIKEGALIRFCDRTIVPNRRAARLMYAVYGRQPPHVIPDVGHDGHAPGVTWREYGMELRAMYARLSNTPATGASAVCRYSTLNEYIAVNKERAKC